MALGADGKVWRRPLDAVDELPEHGSGDVPVAVDETEVPPLSETKTDAKRMALALVDGQVDHLYLGTELLEPGVAAIGRAVRDGDHLEGDLAVSKELDDLTDMADKARTRVVVRHHDCQLELAFGLHVPNPGMLAAAPRRGAGLSADVAGDVLLGALVEGRFEDLDGRADLDELTHAVLT